MMMSCVLDNVKEGKGNCMDSRHVTERELTRLGEEGCS